MICVMDLMDFVRFYGVARYDARSRRRCFFHVITRAHDVIIISHGDSPNKTLIENKVLSYIGIRIQRNNTC